jgi:AcrR family transcriptional regulator
VTKTTDSKDVSAAPKPRRRTAAAAGPATAAPARKRTAKGGKTTKEAILLAAEIEFARSGYDGASVQRIGKQARCYESLLYYHYGSKDKLFAAVLENAYRKLVEAEAQLDVDFDDPCGALEAVVRFMWRYYQEHPELIFLLNTENLLKGKHLKKASGIRDFCPNAITLLRKAVESGMAQGLFRPDVHIDDLYSTVMGLGYFYLSNRHTLSAFFDRICCSRPSCSAGATTWWRRCCAWCSSHRPRPRPRVRNSGAGPGPRSGRCRRPCP